MMVKFFILLFSANMIGASLFWFAPESACNDRLYNKIVTIDGKVSSRVVETGEVGPAQGETIIFQRVNCKSCLFAVNTDSNGRYSIRVGAGKYRIFISDCGRSRMEDCIAEGQPRVVEAIVKPTRTTFDIMLTYRKADEILDITPLPQPDVELN